MKRRGRTRRRRGNEKRRRRRQEGGGKRRSHEICKNAGQLVKNEVRSWKRRLQTVTKCHRESYCNRATKFLTERMDGRTERPSSWIRRLLTVRNSHRVS